MNKELKLQLENFQSISSGELIFSPGLNFIIGQSNSGKSATFRALKACLSNTPGSQRFIKNGTKQSAVTLEYNENFITWKRTAKENSYYINGETYLKTGKSDAFKLISDTGFVKDSNDIIMNIEEELQLPFPFGISKADLFKLFENVFCISDSATILKSAKSQEDKVKFDKENLESELIKNNKKIEELDKFREEVSLDKLKSWKEFLSKNLSRKTFLNEGLELIKTALKLHEANLTFTDFQTEDKIINYMELRELKKLIIKLKSSHSLLKSIPSKEVNEVNLNEYNELIKIKNLVNKVVLLNNIIISELNIIDKGDRYKELTETNRIVKRALALRNISFHDYTIEDKLCKYNELQKFINIVNQIKLMKNVKLPEFEIKDMLNDLKELKNIRLFLTNIKKQKKEKEEELSKLNIKIAEIEKELKGFKVCPLCHKELEE